MPSSTVARPGSTSRMARVGESLEISVTDHGAGGAAPELGTGLRGIERRLSAFDGTLAVDSRPAGRRPWRWLCRARRPRRRPRPPPRRPDPAARGARLRGRRGRRQRTVAAAGADHAPSRCRRRRRPAAADLHRRGAAGRPRGPPAIPGLPVLVLSQYVEQLYARELLADRTGGVGYLLKDRVSNVAAVRRRRAPGRRRRDRDGPGGRRAAAHRRSGHQPLASLTPREREVLSHMAEGRSTRPSPPSMFITEKAVSKHTNSIFARLALPPSEDDNRRVLAVLAYPNA